MLYRSFQYAFKGIARIIREERNFRIMIVCFVLVVIVGILVDLSGIEWALVLLCGGGVLCFEMLNTAIESAVDLAKPETHPLAGKIKDIAAGFVLVFSMFAAAIGLIIFLPHIIALLD